MKTGRLGILILGLIMMGGVVHGADQVSTSNGTIIKLFPNANGDLWSIFRGSDIEILTQTSKEDFSFWSFTGSWGKDTSKQNYQSASGYPGNTSGSQSDTVSGGNGYSASIGYGVINYKKGKNWDSYSKSKWSIGYSSNQYTSKAVDKSLNYSSGETNYSYATRGYSLTYTYAMGYEKTIFDQFALGVEATALDVSLTYSKTDRSQEGSSSYSYGYESSGKDIRASDSWLLNVTPFAGFKVYAKVNI